jgi:hypothetical protein
MSGIAVVSHLCRFSAVIALAGASLLSAAGKEIDLVKTNWTDRLITNVIEVRVPANRFVNEYRTNWVEMVRTNTFNVYFTNVLTRMVTNCVLVDVVRTNAIVAYQTNWQVLNLTNWSTVLVFKTNWVRQSLTNLVAVDLPLGTQPRQEQAAQAPLISRAAALTEPLALEAKRAARLTTNNQVEVELKVRWTNGASAPLLVQQWRLESEDGAILCFGQDRDFRREVPPGRYKVQVKAQRDGNGPLLAALGTLAVTPGEVVLQQRPSKKR